MKTLVKKAEIGGGQDKSFEQAFSDLASAYLHDKAPSLVDYQVGFQLIDRNQENTKAVGIFAFQVGKQWLYAPVFFLNGDLKGHELLYIKNQDMFVPLKENWINFILNHKPHVLGEGVDKNLSRLGVLPPSLYQLSRSPNKFASAQKWPSWAQIVAPDIGHFITKSPLEDAKYANVSDLKSILKKASKTTLIELLTCMGNYPKFASWMEQYYGTKTIDDAINGFVERSKETNNVLDGILPKQAAAAGDDVHVFKDIDMEEGGIGLTGLNEKEKETLVSERVLIKDKRNDSSIAYNVQTKISLFNPDVSGIYDIIVKPGVFEKCLVITGPFDTIRRQKFATVVRLDSPRNWINVHPSMIWARLKIEYKEFERWWDDQKSTDSLGKGGPYIIIGPGTDTPGLQGQGTVPFDIERVISNEDGVKTFEVWCHKHCEIDRAGFLPHLDETHYSDRDFNNDYGVYGGKYITLTGKDGAHIRAHGGTIFVPNGYKFIKCKDMIEKKKDKDDGYSPGFSYASDPPGIEPGTLVDAELMLFGKLASLEVRHTGSEVFVNDKIFYPIDALIHLVKDHGLREKQARVILDEAKKDKKKDYLIKYAAPYDLKNQGPSAPNFPEPYIGHDPLTGNNVPTQYMSEHKIPVPDLSSSLTDRSIYAPMGPDPKYGPTGPDRETMQAVDQAAQTGQKEVFDTAVLGAMLKTTSDENMIERNLPDLMKGMDRTGRILFSFYWHKDTFEDRYGKGDLPELEDGLRNAFEAAGDIIIFLKQKSVAGSERDHMSDLKSLAGSDE